MASVHKFDFLIVGLGIAGATLTHRLMLSGKKVCVIDNGKAETSSRIAAGLINPVTGRNYVRSWMIDDLLDEATRYYADFESEFGVEAAIRLDILRVLKDDLEEERWMMRTGDPEYARFMGDVRHGGVVREIFREDSNYGVVHEGMRISFPVILDTIRDALVQNGCYLEGQFDHSALVKDPEGYRYGDIAAQEVIFSEGAGMRRNPFVNALPMSDNKGEILVLRSDKYPTDLMVKRKHFTIPLENGTIWFGSANSWKDTSEEPSEKAFQILKEDLENHYRMAFEIVRQRAAFRPTVKDRRPLLGTHPKYPGMHLFNGFGTKGASLAPYFSKVMMQYLLHDGKLPGEVDIRRFDLPD